MARQTNGSSQSLVTASALDFSAFHCLMVNLWIQYAATSSSAIAIAQGDFSTDGQWGFEPLSGANNLDMYFNVGGSNFQYYPASGLSLNAWHMLTWKFDGTGYTPTGTPVVNKFYIDGSPVSLTGNPGPTNTAITLPNDVVYLGKYSGGNFCAMEIGQLAFWPKTTVATRNRAPSPRVTTGR